MVNLAILTTVSGGHQSTELKNGMAQAVQTQSHPLEVFFEAEKHCIWYHSSNYIIACSLAQILYFVLISNRS